MKNIEIQNQHLVHFKPESQEGFSLPQDQEVLVNSVFGVNKDGVLPARFLSGFVSTFSLARDIGQLSGGKVEVRIFRPTNISAFVNSIPEFVVERQLQQGNEILEIFAANFFPDVEFFIEEDEPLTEGAIDLLSRMSQVIGRGSSDEQQEGLKESGKRIGGEAGANNAFIYAAHHSFGWSDLHHDSIFRHEPGGSVLNTIPPSDKKFKSLRDIVFASSEADVQDLRVGGFHRDLVINMCGTPHYMLLKDKDGCVREPGFDEVLSVLGSEIISDLQSRFKSEHDPQLRENLRKVRQDLEKLMQISSNGDVDAINSLTFGSLVRGEAKI